MAPILPKILRNVDQTKASLLWRTLMGTAAALFLLMQTSCTVLLWDSDFGGSGLEKLQGQVEVREVKRHSSSRVHFDLILVDGDKKLEKRFADHTIQFDLCSQSLGTLEGWGGSLRLVETKSPAFITKIELDERPSAPGHSASGKITIVGSLDPLQADDEIPFRAYDDLSPAERESIWHLWINEGRNLTRFAFLDKQDHPFFWWDKRELTARGPVSVVLHVPGQGQSSYFKFPLPTDGWREIVRMGLNANGQLSWSISPGGEWTETKGANAHASRSPNTDPGQTWPLTLSVPYGKNFGAILWRIPATFITVPFDIIVGIPLFVLVITPVWLITGDFPGH